MEPVINEKEIWTRVCRLRFLAFSNDKIFITTILIPTLDRNRTNIVNDDGMKPINLVPYLDRMAE